jgi:hypothetical protein
MTQNISQTQKLLLLLKQVKKKKKKKKKESATLLPWSRRVQSTAKPIT